MKNKIGPMNKVVSLSDRRKHPRVSDAVALRINAEDRAAPLDPTPTHVVKISCGGMRFMHFESLECNTTVELCLHLPSADQTVQLSSRVVCSGEEKKSAQSRNKPYCIHLEFQNLDTHVHKLLKDHIDSVIAKTGVSHDAHYIA